jgi:hypothetical protein
LQAEKAAHTSVDQEWGRREEAFLFASAAILIARKWRPAKAQPLHGVVCAPYDDLGLRQAQKTTLAREKRRGCPRSGNQFAPAVSMTVAKNT